MNNNELRPGITRVRTGREWDIMGQAHWLLANCDTTFAFETYNPPRSFVPPHIHHTQDEFIYVLEGEYDLVLGTDKYKAGARDLVRMPKGIAHAFYNNNDVPARAIFWVSPAGKLKELFDNIHALEDIDEVVRLSALHDVEFLPPKA